MSFKPFGLDHLAVLGIMAIATVGMVVGACRIRQIGNDQTFRRAWAALMLISALVSWSFEMVHGMIVFPFHPCDLVIFFMVWSFAVGGRFMTELAYFWALAGTTQAVLTPDLREAFPSFGWFAFFLNHGGVVLGAVYLTASGRVRATLGSVLRIWLFSNLYIAVAGILNLLLGTNFCYLSQKPQQPSLLDVMGPWPYYIFWGDLLALTFFFLCYVLDRLIDRRVLIET